MVLAGGTSKDLPVLTDLRSKSALPFGGRYRVIDFCLSNCANSGIHDVGILAQYNPASLIAHVGNGKPWDLNRRRGGLMVLQPYAARDESNWFRGTADALRQHRDSIRESSSEVVLVLSADQVYLMDYAPIIEEHRSSGAAATVVVKPNPAGELGRYGGLEADEEGRVRIFEEKPGDLSMGFFSLGIYVFTRRALLDRLDALGENRHDLVYDVLIPMVEEGGVRARRHEGYWADVGWLQKYFEASMAMVRESPPLDLSDRSRPVFSRPEVRSPALVRKGALVSSSYVAGGCLVEGTVRRSILFPGVRVKPGAVVEDSVLFSDTTIGRHAQIRCSVLDKQVEVGDQATVGYGNVTCPNSRFPRAVDSGVTVIGKQANIPEGIRIGRNCLIGSEVGYDFIPRRDIVCGETIIGEVRWQEIS
jgi:glucose-1-phosphate adenylyltransferase